MQLGKRNNNHTRVPRSFHRAVLSPAPLCAWALMLGRGARGTDLGGLFPTPTLLQTRALGRPPLGLAQRLLGDGAHTPAAHCALARLLVWGTLVELSGSGWASAWRTCFLGRRWAQPAGEPLGSPGVSRRPLPVLCPGHWVSGTWTQPMHIC